MAKIYDIDNGLRLLYNTGVLLCIKGCKMKKVILIVSTLVIWDGFSMNGENVNESNFQNSEPVAEISETSQKIEKNCVEDLINFISCLPIMYESGLLSSKERDRFLELAGEVRSKYKTLDEAQEAFSGDGKPKSGFLFLGYLRLKDIYAYEPAEAFEKFMSSIVPFRY